MKIINRALIESYSKTINENGCWIPNRATLGNGYVPITIERKKYLLHRLSLSIYHNINYYDWSIETRHSVGCSRACFNPEHIKPGSSSDNKQDLSKTRTHCRRCFKLYTRSVIRTGIRKGKVYSFCSDCCNNSNKGKNDL